MRGVNSIDVKSWPPFPTWCKHRLLTLGAVCLVVTTACGGSSESTSSAAGTTTPTGSASATATATATVTTQACADAAALKESANTLDQLDPREVGKSGVQAALQDVQTRLDAVKVSAGGQWGSQVSEVDAALSALQESVAAVNRNNVLSQLPAIDSKAEELEQAWTSLERDIDQTCPTA
jgi:hypothetical protein